MLRGSFCFIFVIIKWTSPKFFGYVCIYEDKKVRVLGGIDFHFTFHHLVTDLQREMTTLLCTECGKSFTEEANLYIHQSRTHDKTSYSCDECGTDVIGKVALNNHKRRHKTPVAKNLRTMHKCETSRTTSVMGSGYSQSLLILKFRDILDR